MSRHRWHVSGDTRETRSSWLHESDHSGAITTEELQQEPLLGFDSTSHSLDCEVMACHDRTGEFNTVLRTLQSRQLNGMAPHLTNSTLQSSQKTARNPALRQHSEFMRIAKLIGRDIGNTYAKLEKLALLAKRRSLFDDRPAEVQELTHIIKLDMDSLNKQILQLQQLGRRAAADNQQFPATGRHVHSFNANVVVALQSRLAGMSGEFKQLLELRSENMRSQRSRRDHFTRTAAAPCSAASSALLAHGSQGSVLLADEAAATCEAGSSHVVLNMAGVRERGAAGQQQQQLMLLQQEDDYYQARSDTMKNIESTIVELGAIFQQLAHMVKEQEEVVQRIDSNVEDASMNVDAAHSEILKYFQSVSNNRWLMLKVFGVLLFFFLIFVLFLA